MKSEYKYRFLLRLGEAARVGWACAMVSAVLLYFPSLFNKIASVPILSPILAILLAGPSLGTVLNNSWGILSVTIPALSATIAVLKVIHPPISKFAAIACTGAFSYLIAYLSETHLMGRKLALAQCAIVFISAHYSPNINVVAFPLKMIAPTALGILTAIIATLFPIPRLAVQEVRESAKSAARGSSELFKAMVKTISAPDPSAFGSLHLHSKVLAKASAKSISDLKAKQVDIRWELGARGTRHADKRFTKGLDCLNLHLTGMEMALESGYVLQTPAPLRGILQGTLMQTVDQCKNLLDFAVRALPWLISPPIDERSRQKVIEDGKEMLNAFDMSYRAAREQAYYTFSTEEADDWQDYRPGSSLPDLHFVRESFRGRVSMLFFLFNLRLYIIEAINLVEAGHPSANKMHQLAKLGPTLTGLEHSNTDQSKSAEDDSKTGSPHRKKLPDPVFLRPDDPAMIGSRRLSSARISSSRRFSSGHISIGPVSRQSSHRAKVFSEDALPQIATSESAQNAREANAEEKEDKEEKEAKECAHQNAEAMQKIINSAGGVNNSRSWKFLRKMGLKPSKVQTKRSLKISLSMILATIFGILVLPQSQAYWAPVTVGFIIGNFSGGSWRIANLRLQGTVLGSIYGFLALSLSNNHRWAILLLLVPWVIFSSYIRYSPDVGYAGAVAAFTAAIMMLGGFHVDIKQFAMDRITETFVGILCFIFVETVIFPERAVVMVRQESVSSLVSLRDCVAAIVSIYTEPDLQECQHCRSLAIKEIKQLEQRLRGSFAKQSVLLKEAVLEPDLWFVPFPGEVYSKIIAIQRRMLDLLYFMVCSLHATTEDCVTEQMETLLEPLRTSLTALQEEVLSSIDILQEVLQVKRDGKFHRLKRWLGRCRPRWGSSAGDVEQPPQPTSPHPHHPLLVLGRRHRSVDGVPTNLKAIMDSFERSFEDVLNDHVNALKTKAGDNELILSNTAILSVGSLTFSLHSLLRETVQLEVAVHELLQAESPWRVLDFWDNYTTGVLSQNASETKS